MKNEYRCVVVGFMPIAAVMAASIERTANEMTDEGYSLVSMSYVGEREAILVFSREKAEITAEICSGKSTDKTNK